MAKRSLSREEQLALQVKCPACRRGVGERCITGSGNQAAVSHIPRYRLARRTGGELPAQPVIDDLILEDTVEQTAEQEATVNAWANGLRILHYFEKDNFYVRVAQVLLDLGFDDHIPLKESNGGTVHDRS